MKNFTVETILEKNNNALLLEAFAKKLGIILPQNFIFIASLGDYVTLTHKYFSYTDNKKKKLDYFSFLPWQDKFSDSVFNLYNNSPEFFPEKLVPFASNGGGDYICFDYRNCRENPPVVIWKHERNPGEDVFFIAHTFDDFIESLQKDEEVEW